MAKDEDEIILPKKSAKPSGKKKASSSAGASSSMRKLMRFTCAFGIALGGFVALVGVMSVVGIAISNVWVRLAVGVLVVVGLPAFLADRMLKRADANLATAGSLGMVANVFAIVLLGISLVLVSADKMTSSLVAHEGDLYARSGSMTMARLVYFIAGVSPVFPGDKPAVKPTGSASSSASGAPLAPSAAASPK